MRYGLEDGDFEDQASTITGALDALEDLLSGQDPMSQVQPHKMCYLVKLVGQAAHRLLDDEERPRGGPLRAVD